MPIQVSVCGPRDGTPDDEANTYRIGQLLAEHGAVVICGGGTGVMAAVAKGVRSRNGLVIVVGGSWGTLSELALAKRRGGVPVISLGGWRLTDAAGNPVPGIEEVTTAEDAVTQALLRIHEGSADEA